MDSQTTGSLDDFFVDGWDIAVDGGHTSIGIGELPRRSVMGLKVDLRAFGRLELLTFAVALTTAAIIGKQVCSLAVTEKGINRLVVGLGKIPRGEVGLIFAGIGASLTLPAAQGLGEPVVSAATFSVVVIMVIVTTLLTPPALKWAIGKSADQLRSTTV